MFRELVSPRFSATAELEAVTAERDFFKEKYAAHASEMEALKTQLKESQRMVDKLRRQVLDLEAKKCRGVGGSSSCHSLAELDNGGGSEFVADNDADSHEQRRKSSFVGEVATPLSKNKQTDGEDQISEKENCVKYDEIDSEEGESEKECDDGDEADAIRLKAERMLAWASYQSTRRTPSTPLADIKDDDSTDLPTTIRESATTTPSSKILDLARDEDDGHAYRSLVQQVATFKQSVKGGRINRFVNNLKDVMGTQSESESSYEDESDISDSDCSDLNDNLERMQLDVKYADSQDEH